MLVLTFFLIGLSLLDVSYSEVADPGLQAKIKWNIFLNEIYDSAKQPRSLARTLQPTAIDKFNAFVSKHDSTQLIKNPKAQLEKILETATEAPEISCNGNSSLTIEATNIKTSDLANSLKCNGDYTALIEIFVRDTITFDQDLDLRGFSGLLSIFASTWSIQNSTTINLDGPAAQEITPSKAANGQGSGGSGTTGLPGNSGSTAGSFFGFGGTFENAKLLKITANGSNGVKGQDGGDGVDGSNGHTADVEGGLYNCYESGLVRHCSGEPGTPGGSGGDGGHGGFGGFKGEVILLNTIEVTIETKDGSDGAAGSGGSAGVGGMEGDSWKGTHALGVWTFVEKSGDGTVRADDGNAGQAGANEDGLTQPNNPTSVTTQAQRIITDYESFVMRNLDDDLLREQQYEVFLKLLSNTQFQHFYTTEGIIQEFMTLEENFYELQEKIDFVPIYEKLLEHISVVTDKESIDDDSKIALTYLYTTILSKVSALQDQTNKYFITDLKTFLDICIDDINQLNDISTAVAIGEYNTVYKSEIDRQIEEGESLVQQYIIPKIEETTAKMEADLQHLSEEIVELQAEAQKEQYELETQKRQLKNKLFGDIFMGAATAVAGILSFVPGVGSAAGVVINVINQVTGKNQTGEAVGSDYTDLRNQYAGIVNADAEEMKQDIAEFQSQLDELNSLIPADDDAFASIKDDAKAIGEQLQTWNGTQDQLFDTYFEAVGRIESQLNATGSEDAPKSRQLPTGSRSLLGTIVEKVKGMGNVGTVLKTGYNIFKLYKKDKEGMAVIAAQIEENAETIELFKSYKTKIHTTLMPMLTEMGDTLTNLENNLNSESTIKLEVTKWQVKNTLNSVKEILQEYTEGFDVDDDLSKAEDFIMDSVNSMINVYDKIQNFQNQKKFSDYFALVSTAEYDRSKIENEELRNSLNKLELYLQSNIILSKYRQSLTQIKQFAFPLAKTYFTETFLPRALQWEDTIETYTQNAIAQIEKFQTKLYDSTIYITKFDDIKHQAEFYDYSSAGPFVVWPNRTHHDSISKLLTGEEVVFYADPSSHAKNGIKFNLIGLQFKSPTYQKNVDEILNDFEIVLTHMGNNYYSCNDRTYLVATSSQKFALDFKKVDNVPVDSNLVFQKIEKGNFLMSPFTTWKIQLVNRTANGYDSLKAYGPGSDLQLVGIGEYFERNEELCDADLYQYYDVPNVEQQKEEECIKVLSSGIFNKNDACVVDYKEKILKVQ